MSILGGSRSSEDLSDLDDVDPDKLDRVLSPFCHHPPRDFRNTSSTEGEQ